MMPPPRAVVFDAVGTLIYPHPRAWDVYANAAARQGVDLDPNQLEHRLRSALTVDARDRSSTRTNEAREVQRWREIVRTVLPEVPDHDRAFRELWDHFARAEAWRCYPDVEPTLLGLQRNHVPWLIGSNFDGRLHAVVQGLPELRFTAAVLVSSEVGWRKPAVEFYRAAAATLGLTCQDLLMVGDDWSSDIAGGEAAGARVCHLDRRGSRGAMATLTELLAIWET